MRTILILSCLLGLSLSYIFTVPCGRCVGLGQPCVYDSCTAGLVCRTVSASGAPVCVQQVQLGKYCDGQKAFDPCPTDFVCDRVRSKNSVPQYPFGEYNDGCLDDTYCGIGLSCKKKSL